ncbi:NADH-quinone oxidoreductase subunit J [Pontivivens insulae]|uniref:NADH-quinone oxidoreductase subunit J n=1 Tax=Pontivivens insulae TaxID=1639689 RepID=A0A2R8AC98_9RHOB|nr:NADH-quinone oxidoreductase subunit J [Pontivivens insulae]RED13787.1 NADH dehydrogenase subunit J [Pontivivens insulae]SPF29861.1 NADH-quinone oxidoreductase subunit J [Pontivivens insulae]
MTVAAVIFYLFACTAVASGLLVVLARNPVHSVLWLILTFFTSAGLFIMMGAEFVALLLVIVYVGAVAVLFLFVVMMLDVDFAELKQGIAKHMPIALLVGVVLVMELMLIIGSGLWAGQTEVVREGLSPTPEGVENTVALGQIIYTRYIYLFQASGLILFVAMVGAIVLTLRHRVDVKRQNVITQMHRDPAQAVVMKDVKPGQGI